MSHHFLRAFASLMLALVMAVAGVTPALAEPPSNDDFDAATPVAELPFSDTTDTSEATTAPDDPWTCGSRDSSVWYAFTPTADMNIEASTYGSNYDTVIAVFTGVRGGLDEIACLDGYAPNLQERISLSVSAGVTYYFLIAGYWGTTGDNLVFSIQPLAPPSHDDLDAATKVYELPFTDQVNAFGASTALDDPTTCFDDVYPTGSTVWYSLTAGEDMIIEANTSGSEYRTTLSVYTGLRGGLTQIACNNYTYSFDTRVRFYAREGTTYYFLVARKLGWIGANLTFSVLEYFPQQMPVADFWVDPGDPYVSENVTLCAASYDPEEVGSMSLAWDFGDGTFSTESCVEHPYAVDADYTVTLRITTPDGRSASTSQVVQVRTHDVAITKLLAPIAAKSGQIRPVTVFVKNLRYDETVSIELYKSGPESDELIGYSVQFVPVRAGNRTTAFTFNYTFTLTDATAGEVTFHAIANIQDARDAFPENNEATSSPTRITK